MELLVLNEKFQSIYVMDTFESLIWTDRYDSYGDFEIYTSADQKLIDFLKVDYYLWSSESDHVMIIENWKIESDVEFGNHFTITGRSLESILLRRIIWKKIILNGKLEEQIEKLLNENVINPSDNRRKIPNFIFLSSSDPQIEELKIESQYTGDVIYDVINKICSTFHIGFKITLDNENNFVFQLYSGANRSYAQDKNPYVVFSPNFENIINSDYYENKKDYRNVTLVAGEGEDQDRRTLEVGDANVSGLHRREIYTDARDISSISSGSSLSTAQYNNLLRQRGTEKLDDYKITKLFEGEVETTQLYQYKKDFYMGDIVQLENEYGMESTVRILEFIYSEDKAGTKSYPSFEVLENSDIEEE